MIPEEKVSDKVLIALCGKKESIVTAWLLKKQGMHLRAVYLDFKKESPEIIQKAVQAIEKKLGIAIQVIACHDEVEALFQVEKARAETEGYSVDLKQIFHQKVLFPKLFQLKEAHQFAKIATGHRATVQLDSVENLTHVLRYNDLVQDESALLVGLSQAQIASLVLPLGSIPTNMIEKIATELQVSGTSSSLSQVPELGGTGKSASSTPVLPISMEVVTFEGARVGSFPDMAQVKLGDPFADPTNPEVSYVVSEIDFIHNRVQVTDSGRRVLQELHCDQASWFLLDDLNFESLRCSVTWGSRSEAYPVRVMQYEGQRLKAFFETPVHGRDADVFIGQTVLWVSGGNTPGGQGGQQVLGGARVMKTL